MKKIFFLFLCLVFLLTPRFVFAQAEFSTNATVHYDVNDNGITTVTHNISLTNIYSNIYAVDYSLTVQGIKPENPRAYDGQTPMKVDNIIAGDKTTLKVNFPSPLVGKGARRSFSIIYEDKSLANKTGEVWEVTVPKLADASAYDSYTAVLSVPGSFGQLAYISPQPSIRGNSNGRNTYTFDKSDVSKGGVTAAFGQFQVFAFNLVYHLENPLNRPGNIDIAIPPDTAYQKMNYSDITPKPVRITVDEDGNWLANFELKSRERVDIKVTGSVQIFAQAREFPGSSLLSLDYDKKESTVWQVNDPYIINLAQKLKTPRAIYDYVTSTLSYDYSRVQPNVQRLGAKAALLSPKTAICTEFTDAFIALARAAGIPAREINGYAYTENPQIQPLSLVADVLHAWPEYWDSAKRVWVPVDPTWGSTTNGAIDYFSKLDLRHFTFVIHGKDSQKPYPPGSYKLGPNPQKDVFVSFGQLPVNRFSNPSIKILSQQSIPVADMQLVAQIKNPGPVALYNKKIEVFFDNKKVSEKNLDILPPFDNYELPITVPYKFLGQGVPANVRVQMAETFSEAPTYKLMVAISNALAVLVIIFIVMFLVYFKFVKHRYEKNSKGNSGGQNTS